MNIDERIGYEMRSARLLKRMSLQQVADRLDKAKQTISYWELGKTKITVVDLQRYCEVVGCNWLDILKRASGED